jgi:clan AA aspartic protease
MGVSGTPAGRQDDCRAAKVMLGRFYSRFPRLSLTLPSSRGPLDIEFIIDTGFDGELALPDDILAMLDVSMSETRFVQLAGGFRQRCDSYEVLLDWNDDERLVEVLTLDGNPLIGNGLWEGFFLQAENVGDGEVSLEAI